MDTCEPVALVSIETGDDLILSFFVTDAEDPEDGRTLTLLRDWKWERLLPDPERGVKVFDEGVPENEQGPDNYLEEIRVTDTTVELKSTFFARKLDVSRLTRTDQKAMKKVLKKMNFDRRFRLQAA